MPVDIKEQEYWNDVSVKTCTDQYNIKDNFDKRKLILREMINYDFRKAKVLEIGSGLAITAHLLSIINNPINYTGIDVSDHFAKRANELFGFNIVVGDAKELPFPDGEFNAIWAFDSFEHIHPDKRESMYKEIHRVLHPQHRGIFINNPFIESLHDPEYDYGFEEKDITRLCEVTGLRIVHATIMESKGYRYQFLGLGPVPKAIG